MDTDESDLFYRPNPGDGLTDDLDGDRAPTLINALQGKIGEDHRAGPYLQAAVRSHSAGNLDTCVFNLRLALRLCPELRDDLDFAALIAELTGFPAEVAVASLLHHVYTRTPSDPLAKARRQRSVLDILILVMLATLGWAMCAVSPLWCVPSYYGLTILFYAALVFAWLPVALFMWWRSDRTEIGELVGRVVLIIFLTTGLCGLQMKALPVDRAPAALPLRLLGTYGLGCESQELEGGRVRYHCSACNIFDHDLLAAEFEGRQGWPIMLLKHVEFFQDDERCMQSG